MNRTTFSIPISLNNIHLEYHLNLISNIAFELWFRVINIIVRSIVTISSTNTIQIRNNVFVIFFFFFLSLYSNSNCCLNLISWLGLSVYTKFVRNENLLRYEFRTNYQCCCCCLFIGTASVLLWNFALSHSSIPIATTVKFAISSLPFW